MATCVTQTLRAHWPVLSFPGLLIGCSHRQKPRASPAQLQGHSKCLPGPRETEDHFRSNIQAPMQKEWLGHTPFRGVEKQRDWISVLHVLNPTLKEETRSGEGAHGILSPSSNRLPGIRPLPLPIRSLSLTAHSVGTWKSQWISSPRWTSWCS